jgi:hypothetical protein
MGVITFGCHFPRWVVRTYQVSAHPNRLFEFTPAQVIFQHRPVQAGCGLKPEAIT